MSPVLPSLIFCALACSPLPAGTVVITSVADPQHSGTPLTALDGIPLAAGTLIRVGAFPGMDDDEVLDLAAQGGLAGIHGAFTPFGSTFAIGQGVDGAAGGFEIAAKETSANAPWLGEVVSLCVETASGEFLVARFPGATFAATSDTGLEPLLALHLADARIIVGSRAAANRIATSTVPQAGSFGTWLAGHPGITDPLMKLPSADADGDGRSNFLEYATGGNPASGDDPPPCWIQADGSGGWWVRFRHVPGLGSVRYTLQASANPAQSWTDAGGALTPDPESPATMRLRVPPPLDPSGFFRLVVESAP